MTMTRRVVLSCLFFLLVAAPLVLTMGYLASAGISHERQEMMLLLRNSLDQRAAEIEREHQEAQRDMLMAMENPDFHDYFTLPENKAGNRYDANKVLQFTPAQETLRKRLEGWVTALQRRFPIVETCLIDKTGQEHLRIAGGVVAAPHEFSSDEWDAPFFKASMAAEAGRVLVAEPYMSIDADEWVIAYTSPIVLPGGARPAFYHYELPLAMFQNLLRSGEGGYFQKSGHAKAAPQFQEYHHAPAERLLIVNAQGMVVADSGRKIEYTLKPERNPNLNPNLPDFLPPEKLADYLPPLKSVFNDPDHVKGLLQEMAKNGSGVATVMVQDKPHWLAYRSLDIFHWGMIALQPEPVLSLRTWLREASAGMGQGLAMVLALMMAATGWFSWALGRVR